MLPYLEKRAAALAQGLVFELVRGDFKWRPVPRSELPEPVVSPVDVEHGSALENLLDGGLAACAPEEGLLVGAHALDRVARGLGVIGIATGLPLVPISSIGRARGCALATRGSGGDLARDRSRSLQLRLEPRALLPLALCLDTVRLGGLRAGFHDTLDHAQIGPRLLWLRQLEFPPSNLKIPELCVGPLLVTNEREVE